MTKPAPTTPAIDEQIMDTFMEGVAMKITPQQFLTKLKASLNQFYAEGMLKIIKEAVGTRIEINGTIFTVTFTDELRTAITKRWL